MGFSPLCSVDAILVEAAQVSPYLLFFNKMFPLSKEIGEFATINLKEDCS